MNDIEKQIEGVEENENKERNINMNRLNKNNEKNKTIMYIVVGITILLLEEP